MDRSGQNEVAIVGKNNTKAGVTGQNELLVKISDTDVTAIATAIATAQGINTFTTSFVEVAAADVDTWDASVGFTSDAISFVERNKSLPFSFQVTDYTITPGTPTLTLEVSLDGVAYTRYNLAGSLIDITDASSGRYFFTDRSTFEYARFVYVSGGSTGTFSLLINK